MRRFLSIALLLLFLFNVAGYQLFFWGLHYRAAVKMSQRLEAEDYSPDETVTLKVPFALPYHMDTREYETASGSFDIGGEFFSLVKQKLERDTLYMICIRDRQAKQIFNTMTDFVKSANDFPASSQKTLKLLGNFIKDYLPTPGIDDHEDQGNELTFNFLSYHPTLPAIALPVLSPPPELFS